MKVTYESVIQLYKNKDKTRPYYKNLVSEFFWPIAEWPKHIVLNLYWCEFSDRISIISFLFMNGLTLEIALKIIEFYCLPSRNGTSWKVRERQLKSVWHRCRQIALHGPADLKEKYFYYSMWERKVYNYAGDLKLNKKLVKFNNRDVAEPKNECLKDLLNENEELEKSACEAAAQAERDYEQSVLHDIIMEIRAQH